MAANSSTTREPALSKFIEALLVPVERGTIVDTAYNKQLRHERWLKWREARRRYEFWRALDDAALSLSMSRNVDAPAGLTLPSRAMCSSEVRRTYAELLRTPSFDRTTVAWKKRQRTGGYYGFDAHELRQIIEADEDFLDAHPITSRPRLPKSKRT
jgi:hypothetical protein